MANFKSAVTAVLSRNFPRGLSRRPAPGRELLRRPSQQTVAVAALTVLAAVTALLYLGAGAVHLTPWQTLATLVKPLGLDFHVPVTPLQISTLWMLRLPRAVSCVAAGAGLGLAGAVSQGVFRNGLADPALLGASSGGALATAALGAFCSWLGPWPMAAFEPLVASLGAAAALAVVYRITHLRPWRSPSSMILCGLAVNALTVAFTGLMTYTQSGAEMRRLSYWTLGGLSQTSWAPVVAASVVVLAAACLLPKLARPLDAMLLGEIEARHLGFDTRRIKILAVVVIALLTGASVAAAGVIAFVGLMAPHLARILVGCNHRTLLPASAALAAAGLLATDAVARTWAAPAEIPVGLLTAVIGAPFFLWLLSHDNAHTEG